MKMRTCMGSCARHLEQDAPDRPTAWRLLRFGVALGRAPRRVQRFAPQYLVVLLGLDTAKGDPTGTLTLRAGDFEENGRLIRALRLPTLVIQEGGYDNRVLGVNARNFLVGLATGAGRRADAATGT